MAKDHFVPQLYLKKFSIKDRWEYVYRYRRGEEPVPAHVSEVAAQKDYNSVTLIETGEKSDQFEQWFSRVIESPATPVIDRLVSEPTPITLMPTELTILARFISFLSLRGPAFRTKVHLADVGLYKEWVRLVTKDLESYRAAAERINVVYTDDEELESLRQEMLEKNMPILEGEVEIKEKRGQQGFAIKQMMDREEELTPLIFYRDWKILETQSPDTFITCDNPVLMFSADDSQQTEGELWNTGIIVLTISPERCLFISPGKATGELSSVKPTPEQVDEANGRLILNANREVYAHISSDKIKEEFSKSKQGENLELVDPEDGE